MYNLLTLPGKSYFKMFDSKQYPSLLYGSEIWGLEVRDCIEQIYACKRFMNISLKSCNACNVMGDCGRYPTHIYM
jgi:hypothetical protein